MTLKLYMIYEIDIHLLNILNINKYINVLKHKITASILYFKSI